MFLFFRPSTKAWPIAARTRKHVGITFEGDLINADGFIRSGSANKNVGIRVGLKDKIEQLERKAIVCRR